MDDSNVERRKTGLAKKVQEGERVRVVGTSRKGVNQIMEKVKKLHWENMERHQMAVTKAVLNDVLSQGNVSISKPVKN